MFGQVDNDILEIEKEMVDFEQQLISNYFQEMEADFLKCKQRHLHYLHSEETMCCQKSCIKWLVDGDANTAFFSRFFEV